MRRILLIHYCLILKPNKKAVTISGHTLSSYFILIMRIRFTLMTPLIGVLLFSLGYIQPVSAQDMQCQEELSQANALYTVGRFDEAIERVDACLEKESLSDMERRTAYRLKGLSFIGKGVEVDAKASVRLLMELFPNYEPDPVQDPPDFVSLVNEMREEINQELADQEEPTDPVQTEAQEGEAPVTQTPPDTTPEPVAQVAKKKKKGAGRFILIGAGLAAAGGAAILLTGGGDGGGGGGVEISDPPPLPN